MALSIEKIPVAVAGVIGAIADGVAIAAAIVDVVEPPERVSFSIEAIANVNSLERVEVTIKNLGSVAQLSGAQVSEERLFLDGVLTQTNVVTVSPALTTTASSAIVSRKTNFEDESVGVSFDVPGPGYQPKRNRVAAGG